jgi:hypothetical protein
MARYTSVWLLSSMCLGFGAGRAMHATPVVAAAPLKAEAAVPQALAGRGCRLGNAVVPRPSEPAVATICERSGEVMQGFLMHGAERIAVCCPVPTK